MNEEFEKWWVANWKQLTDIPCYPSHMAQAAFIAGAAAMREEAAKVAESYYRESGMTEVIAGAIRRLEVN